MAHMSLGIRAVQPEPSLLPYTKYMEVENVSDIILDLYLTR